MRKKLTLILLIFLSGIFFAKNTLSIELNGEGAWNINFTSDADIAGFQYDDDITVNVASSDETAANDFMISANSTPIFIFSLFGTTILAGNGTLIIINVTGTPSGLSNIIMSDAVGNELDLTYLSSAGDGPAEFVFNQSILLAGYFFLKVSLDGTTLESDDWGGAFNGDICVGAHQWDTSGYHNGVSEITAN